jgi:quercetin dioxygenase-like cupin family protein
MPQPATTPDLHPTAGHPGITRGEDAEPLLQGPLGAYLLADGERTGGAASAVLHTLEPRALGAPVHTHRHEDEYSYILAGVVGVELDGTTVVAGPGDLVTKPRGVPHAFFNAGDEPARLLEVITPAGFERYFSRLAELFASAGPAPEALVALAADFGLDVDPGSVPRLAEQHGLALP